MQIRVSAGFPLVWVLQVGCFQDPYLNASQRERAGMVAWKAKSWRTLKNWPEKNTLSLFSPKQQHPTAGKVYGGLCSLV